MNIAIDVLGLLSKVSRNRGIGNYVKEQLKNLFKDDKLNRYFLFNFYENVSLKEILEYDNNVTEHYFCFGYDDFAFRNKDYYPLLGNVIKKIIDEHKIDIYVITSAFGEIIYDPNWFLKTHYLTVHYDIIPYLFLEYYFPVEDRSAEYRKNRYMEHLDFAISSYAIIAISQTTKKDLVKHFNVAPNKIYIFYPCVSENFFEQTINVIQQQNLKEKFGIAKEFILCVSGDDKRKNTSELVEAYSKLSIELKNRYQLVIVFHISKGNIPYYEDIKSKFNLQNDVIFTNFVSDEELAALYNMAFVFAFVSQYEGFGLPVLEAWQCGLPVLTSNNSSLGEIAEGAAVLVDPFNILDITRGLEEILMKTDISKLRLRGFERVKDFKNTKSISDVFKSLEQNSDIKYIKNKMTIAFFTPLPPMLSGISDYSVDILCELANEYDIDVFIDDDYTAECDLPCNVKVFSHKEFDKRIVLYDRYIFQVGNSEFHTYMFPYISKYSGIVVLHDFNLQGILRIHSIIPNSGDFKEYSKLLSYDYDKDTIDHIISETFNWKREIVHKYPANGFVTAHASKVIVHSKYAKKEFLMRRSNINVMDIPLCAKISQNDIIETKMRARKILGIPQDKTVISSFGIITKAKRILPIIKALNKLLASNENIISYFAGFNRINGIDEYLKNNHLDKSIFITGRLELEKFLLYMDASDICINLRYPYNGENSAAAARLLAKGKCVLVTDIGSFSEIPDECCVKLNSPENLTEHQEIDMIYDALQNLMNDPARIQEIGKRAYEYAKNNLDIKIIALKYIDAINNSPNLIFSNEYLSYLKDDFAQYTLNKKCIKEFEKTILYAQMKLKLRQKCNNK
jgi:glycosyltransferase involved in cell wall biosynthesis